MSRPSAGPGQPAPSMSGGGAHGAPFQGPMKVGDAPEWVASARGSEVCTNGVRVLVHPVYDAEQSTPSAREWLFAYRIRIVNERTDGPTAGRTVQLLSRKWTIIDAAGRVREVEGDGVVGQQPVLAPGECFEYASLCPLNTAWGTMEGTYTFRGADGAGFAVGIGRFFLVGK